MSSRTASQIGKSNVATSKSHERRVAKLFTDWTGHQFRRRRNEGRDVSTIVRDATGDVIPVSKPVWFNIEAKKGKTFSLDALLNVDTIATAKMSEWWHQSHWDAQLYSDIIGVEILPLLVFKPIPNWDWITFSQDSLKYLTPSKEYISDGRDHCLRVSGDELWFPAFRIDAYEYCGPVSHNVKHTHKENKQFESINLKPCYISRWRTFSENVNPESFFIPEKHQCHVVEAKAGQ